MINKILRKFGFIKIEDIDTYYLDLYPNSIFKEQFDSGKYSELTDRLRKIPEFREYCDWTAIQDTKRFYNANPDEHALIRGAVSRTRHFRSLSTDAVDKKLANQRYL